MGLTELRERFERWAKEENLDLKRGRLDYKSEETYSAWCAWRAAIADVRYGTLKIAAEELLDTLSDEMKGTAEARNLSAALEESK